MTFQEIYNLIPQYTEEQRKQIDSLYREELRKHSEKVVVLDDDPTGTQTVHGVYVYTSWEKETFDEAFASKDKIFYILTNSRSFTKQRTIQVHKEILKMELLWMARYSVRFSRRGEDILITVSIMYVRGKRCCLLQRQNLRRIQALDTIHRI